MSIDTRPDTDNNVIPFPAERRQRSTWKRLCALPDDLDTAIAQLHEFPYEPPTAAQPDEQPAMTPQVVPLYATVDHGFRQVWHRVVGWQWDAEDGRYVPLLAMLAGVDETVRSTPAAFAFRALNGLRYHDALAL